MDNPLIDKKIGYEMEIPVETQKKNQTNYEKNKSKIQVGNYVYLDFAPKPMDKSFDTKRNEIYRVIRIDAGKTPPLYKLANLMKEEVKGNYYAEQLIKTTKPKRHEYFKIENILGEKLIRGKPYVHVKYLHYSNKFNKWIPKENVIKGPD